MPAIRTLREVEFESPVTFFVGENGSGKSTLMESIAIATGLPAVAATAPRDDETLAAQRLLASALRLSWTRRTRRGFFLRAETMHGFYTYLEANPGGRDPRFHEMSHGESFLAVLETRFDSPGFYALDEPEAALSFSSTLGLIATLQRVVEAGGQVLCATHSPVLAAMPGATILEVGDWGLRRTTWAELELVQHWKSYLDAPGRYLRHLLDD